MWFKLYHTGPLTKGCNNVKTFLLNIYNNNKHKYNSFDVFHYNFKTSHKLIDTNLQIQPDTHSFQCMRDDIPDQLPNPYLEGPCVFIGNHPLRGTCKIGVLKKNVLINISPIYNEELKQKGFRNFTCKREVNWFASWQDEITNERKYLYIPYDNVISKFEQARSLKKSLHFIKKKSLEMTSSYKMKDIQMGLACYLLDTLCIRIGNEKEYETVGICTLSVKHIILLPHQKARFVFSGKDNIPFDKTIYIPQPCFDSLTNCYNISKKNKEPYLLYLINPIMLNNFLSKFDKNITAKVFRTYKACILFQKEYRKHNSKKDALLKVAKLLNHKKIDKKSNTYIYNLSTSWNNYIDHRIYDDKHFKF